MWDFWTNLLDSTGFPPRWSCGVWSPGLGWLHIASDLAIWLAYFAIPCVLGYYAFRRKDLPFRGVLRLFIVFILACGLTHLMEAVIFWWPAYRLAGFLKLLTAIVSWATVVALVRVTPRLMALRSPAELEREIAERQRVEADLRALHAQLEQRVAERTAALEESENRFRAVFEATPSGLIVADSDGQIVLVNDLIVRMFGWEKAELVGQPVERLLPVRYREGHPADRDSYFAAPSERAMGAGRHLTGQRKDGDEFPVEVGLRPVKMAGQSYALASVVDITERKRTEEQLAMTSGRLNAILNAVPVGVSFSDDATCQRITGNPAVLAQFAVRSTDNMSASAADPIAPGRRLQFFQGGRPITDSELPLQRAVAENRVIPPMELVVVLPDGRTWFAEASGAPIHDDRGAVIAGVAVTVDVTARKRAESLIRESEERLRLTLESGAMGTFEVDLQSGEGIWNQVEFELLGLSPADERASPDAFFRYVHPEDVGVLNKQWEIGIRTGKFDAEFRIIRADGQVRWLAGAGSFLPVLVRTGTSAGEVKSRFLGINYDITERKRAEELIKASLREKEVLLKEIHHRVKNNLQIVSALLDLQSRQTKDAAAVEMFRESRGRVKSMALIHERLYRAQDLARVDFAEYTRQLARDLFHTYRVSGDIRLELEVDIPSLPIDIAIPCGLLLNELISNCLKHAFAVAAEGCIWVALRRDETANVLTVADDGAGFPAGFDFRNTTSFGLQLVNTLVEQLGGECVLTPGRGSLFTVRFPKSLSSHEPGALP